MLLEEYPGFLFLIQLLLITRVIHGALHIAIEFHDNDWLNFAKNPIAIEKIDPDRARPQSKIRREPPVPYPYIPVAASKRFLDLLLLAAFSPQAHPSCPSDIHRWRGACDDPASIQLDLSIYTRRGARSD